MFQGREKKGFYFESLSSESDERRRRGSVFDIPRIKKRAG
jgi:hypothetical protein